jgi:monoterpene epsilon-lactone hydrolase
LGISKVGDREILLSDANRITDRARKDAVDAELEVWNGMYHVWHLFARQVPEGQQAIGKIGTFIRKHVGGGHRIFQRLAPGFCAGQSL